MATLQFHIVPNAKQDKVVGEYGTAIKLKLRAPAVEGKANVALRNFLAEQLSISERAIVIEHGYRSRQKLIRIEGLTEEKVRCRLLATGLIALPIKKKVAQRFNAGKIFPKDQVPSGNDRRSNLPTLSRLQETKTGSVSAPRFKINRLN